MSPGARSGAANVGPAARNRTRPASRSVVRYTILLLMFALLAGPLLWQLSLSLKGPGDDIYVSPPQLLPDDPTFDHYVEVTQRLPLVRYFFNSLVVAVLVVVGNVVGATLAGYALGRLRFRGRGAATLVFVAALLVPIETVIIAQFLLIRSLDLNDTLFGVALPGMVAALNVLLMRNSFMAVPRELEEAAVIDGANTWQRFTRVCLPQVKGMISVVVIFSFMGAWNDFLWPLIALSDQQNYTLTVGLNHLRGTFVDDPRLIAAGTIIALVPIVVFFIALQRFFFRGLESGGIKG